MIIKFSIENQLRKWQLGVGLAILLITFFFMSRKPVAVAGDASFWAIESIDTMKYSRDPSREKLKDESFDRIIDQQVGQIAKTGASYVAIGTPYDEEFVPILRRWVEAARRYKLKVWFRGNFSGWEKWFSYEGITREDHKNKTASFISNHADLFAAGDIFTPCPECENGGPGDPRANGDAAGHRKFLIDLYEVSAKSFAAIGKKVEVGYFSMNGDVARLIMDRETTKALGGKVVIDHYVASPQKLRDDIVNYVKQSGGQVVLGEFGAPIPDIHGKMSEEAQAKWIEEALLAVSNIPEVIGINYWTGVGGSTELWDSNGQARKAVAVIARFYSPIIIQGIIYDELDRPIMNAKVTSVLRTSTTDSAGKFSFLHTDDTVDIDITAPGYLNKQIVMERSETENQIYLIKEKEQIWFKILKYLRKVFKKR